MVIRAIDNASHFGGFSCFIGKEGDEEVLAPKITSRYGFYSSPSSTIYMSIDKAENTTVRYTEDGTDPDVSSTKAETNSVSFYSNTPEFKEVRFAAFDEDFLD